MSKQTSKTSWKRLSSLTPVVLLLSLLVTGCGPDLRTQCKKIQKTVFAAQNQGQLGTQDRAAMLKNADNYETLSKTLQTLDVQDNKLKKSVKNLSAAFKEVAISTRSRAQIADEDGVSSYYEDDTEQQQQHTSMLAQEQRASSKVQTSMEQIGIHCNL